MIQIFRNMENILAKHILCACKSANSLKMYSAGDKQEKVWFAVGFSAKLPRSWSLRSLSSPRCLSPAVRGAGADRPIPCRSDVAAWQPQKPHRQRCLGGFCSSVACWSRRSSPKAGAKEADGGEGLCWLLALGSGQGEEKADTGQSSLCLGLLPSLNTQEEKILTVV